MRIIAGKHRGRGLEAPEGRAVRPTTDRMRERVFSMLMHPKYPSLLKARIADLFAGTGAMGLEALSRGAATVTFVEKSQHAYSCLKGNVAKLGESDTTTLLKVSARALPQASEPYDIIFMDPPYRKGLVTPTLHCLLDRGWLAKDGVIICEIAKEDDIALPDGLITIDDRSQGKQRVLFIIRG